MSGGLLIREARRRANITQAELARRLGTSQSVIARWENKKRSPSFDKTVEAVRACGFELSVSLLRYDDEHDIGLAAQLRPLSPQRRLRHLEHALEVERELHRARPVKPHARS
jgi:transcriptional regulator with XRE-family HTH domain